ncbi:hypothetical protein DYB30_010947, partial [Aphanomyces astaci]
MGWSRHPTRLYERWVSGTSASPLAEKQTTFPVWVLVDSVSPCILGINLLRKLKALVNLSTNCVGFGDSPITLPFHTDDAQATPRTVAHLKREDPREPPAQKAHEPAPSASLHNVPTNWPTVHPTSTVYVKSNSRRLVLCRISSDLPEGCPILVESTASLSPLHIARSINIVRKEGFWVQVRNHSDTKLVIRPIDTIGVVSHLSDHYTLRTPVPLPAGGPRVCSIASGVVGAITRGQARASEPPQEPPEAKTIKGVNPKDPSKLPRTPDRYLDGETPVSEGLEDSLVDGGAAPAAEADGVSPLKLPPYYDDTYALPDPVLRKEQARDPFTISMKAYLEDKALPLEEWLMKVVTRTSEHYEVKDQVLHRR